MVFLTVSQSSLKADILAWSVGGGEGIERMRECRREKIWMSKCMSNCHKDRERMDGSLKVTQKLEGRRVGRKRGRKSYGFVCHSIQWMYVPTWGKNWRPEVTSWWILVFICFSCCDLVFVSVSQIKNVIKHCPKYKPSISSGAELKISDPEGKQSVFELLGEIMRFTTCPFLRNWQRQFSLYVIFVFLAN